MKNKVLFLLVMFILILSACNSSNQLPADDYDSMSTLEGNSEIKDNQVENVKIYENDALQNIFLELSVDTTPQELEKMIADNNLFYRVVEYNQLGLAGKEYSYVIAYTEGAAKHRHAEPGSKLEVDFDNGNNNKLKCAYYSNIDAVGYGALFYVYGDWFDFSTQNAEDYQGYYLIGDNDPKKASGITIKYTNGREKETDYIRCDSAEALINQIIDYTNE